MTYAAFGVHKTLIEQEGFDPNSEDYYTELDRRMRTEFPHKFSDTRTQSSTPRVASLEQQLQDQLQEVKGQLS